MIFAVSDVHGHFDELIGLFDTLYNDAGLDNDRDTVVFLGDLVDGGPKTKQVLDWCMEKDKRDNWIFLKGNHEDMLLDAVMKNTRFELWFYQGGQKTLESFLPHMTSPWAVQPADYITKEYLAWLYARPLMYIDDEHIFVHAGLRPEVPLNEQRREDMLWIRDEFSNSEYDFGKTIIYGHTPHREPLVGYQKLGIDTMHHDRGKLTAVELGKEWKFYHQVAGKGLF